MTTIIYRFKSDPAERYNQEEVIHDYQLEEMKKDILAHDGIIIDHYKMRVSQCLNWMENSNSL